MTEKLLRKPVAAEMAGLGESSMLKLVKEGQFPKPIKLSVRSVGWVESDVQKWIKRKIRESKEGGAS